MLKQKSINLTILGTSLSLAFMLAAVSLIFAYAPEEKTMGIIQKVFYFHVPFAWIALLAFLIVFIGSIGFLATGKAVWDTIALSSAQIGVIFNTLMLVSGVLWAKPVWGMWWTWDPRLTTSLVLWFIYLGYLLVRNFGFEKVIGIVGFADVPVVALAIVLWQNLHPSALIFEGGLTHRMLITLIASITAFTLIYVLLMIVNTSLHRMEGMVSELESSVYGDDGEE